MSEEAGIQRIRLMVAHNWLVYHQGWVGVTIVTAADMALGESNLAAVPMGDAHPKGCSAEGW